MNIEATYNQIEEEPVEVQDFGKITNHFGGIFGIYLDLIKKIERCQHVTGWNWKQSDLDQLGPKMSI